ncbi:coiled-coil domain-containing protein 12-like [Pollicipes pollicipes]|uniref:coiled-coil domain-containing protein 12-like n=1 Tax=Pollicipes pollicipes TaxID=41117 RepID=UPI0018855D76|nr:coiled-coil domain-containing protein 12-like [Pollicipes pollicipes]XP_037073569.1 coiled-coil domain-containing protein 12-like [Pollicipes pollicipes]XP_037073570.1 coiled-coil domain-containing protein 12-like [Pollicipes pollicipes]XP_037073571.1 coiled-coil domain-containing protein 12-like [Pollicipes pollicipes]XP_037073572.1 coiled-coil domain-containing protein 12-like [Pollicipes pollicipes]XP_037073573.1 coiled-coil domain-containing protein 12-like [Pollicipes pollicipes]XP_03
MMGTSEDKVGSLEDEAKKRREKLAVLKRRRQERAATNDDEPDYKKDALPKPVFRSYKPIDEKLKESELPEAEPGNVDALLGAVETSDAAAARPEEVDVAQLAPRKPDWDLKRDLAPRLERLERRTQRAIAELIRQRLEREQGADVLVDAVSTAAAAAGDDDDE